MQLDEFAAALVLLEAENQGSRIFAAYPMLAELRTAFPTLPENYVKLALLRAVYDIGGATLWDKGGVGFGRVSS